MLQWHNIVRTHLAIWLTAGSATFFPLCPCLVSTVGMESIESLHGAMANSHYFLHGADWELINQWYVMAQKFENWANMWQLLCHILALIMGFEYISLQWVWACFPLALWNAVPNGPIAELSECQPDTNQYWPTLQPKNRYWPEKNIGQPLNKVDYRTLAVLFFLAYHGSWQLFCLAASKHSSCPVRNPFITVITLRCTLYGICACSSM